MKYALSHPWKFQSINLAFLAGLAQVQVVLTIELSGLSLILIATSIE